MPPRVDGGSIKTQRGWPLQREALSRSIEHNQCRGKALSNSRENNHCRRKPYQYLETVVNIKGVPINIYRE